MKIFLVIYALSFRHRKCDITIMSILGKPFTLFQFVPCSYVFCVVVFKLSKDKKFFPVPKIWILTIYHSMIYRFGYFSNILINVCWFILTHWFQSSFIRSNHIEHGT